MLQTLSLFDLFRKNKQQMFAGRRCRLCQISTFPGKLSRNFQTDGEESNPRRSPLTEKQLGWSATVLVSTVLLQTEEEAAARFWNCESCFEWLKPDGRLFPPRVTAALTHARLLISQLLLWLSSEGPLRLGALFDMWSPGFLPPGGSSSAVVSGGEPSTGGGTPWEPRPPLPRGV